MFLINELFNALTLLVSMIKKNNSARQKVAISDKKCQSIAGLRKIRRKIRDTSHFMRFVE